MTLLSEVETLTSYSSRDDAFFYALVFDPHQKTLLADRGDIRIGSGYQAVVPKVLPPGEENPLKRWDRESFGVFFNTLTHITCFSEDVEELLWSPENPLTDEQVTNFWLAIILKLFPPILH